MRRLVTVMLLVATVPASAQMVYKCVARNGHVTLTSESCPSDQKIAATVHAPPERMSRERQQEIELRRRRDEANSAYLDRLAGFGANRPSASARPSSSQSKSARCRTAKATRDAARRRMGMKVTYEATRRLDEMVYDACK